MSEDSPYWTADGRFLGFFPDSVTADELAEAEARLARADAENLEFLRRCRRLFN